MIMTKYNRNDNNDHDIILIMTKYNHNDNNDHDKIQLQ